VADEIERPRDIDPSELSPEPPDYLQGHDSIWNMGMQAQLGGATDEERQDLVDAHYFGYVDNDDSDRSAWRDYADELRAEYGVELDWQSWREEMGYN
jgi:hypothetical protein